MQDVADELIGLDVHGYRITRKVGSGGMGAVYEANHATIGQRVAIKVLFPEFSQSEDDVRRFVDEARAASKVEHPGLVRIYNHGRLSTNTAFIMMEFLSGESLRKY
jgi:serine/threonine-protein kinase